MLNALMVCLYLAVAVVANLAVNQFGQPALLFTAMVLIPFELTSRDQLHLSWSTAGGLKLVQRMTALILAGSVITAICNPGATTIAIASAIAFLSSATIDAVVFQLLKRRSRFARINLSNVASATVDSIAFPALAFGVAGTSPSLCVAQSLIKVGGGLLWSLFFIWIRPYYRVSKYELDEMSMVTLPANKDARLSIPDQDTGEWTE